MNAEPVATEILETRPGTTHTHVNEVGEFTVTKLVSEVQYILQSNKYFTDWAVTGRDESGRMHTFQCIKRAGLSGESRFCGNFS